jgi:hypothetical protein
MYEPDLEELEDTKGVIRIEQTTQWPKVATMTWLTIMEYLCYK